MTIGLKIDFLTINNGRAVNPATNHKITVVTNAFFAVKRICLGRQTETYLSTEMTVKMRMEKFVAK